MDSIQIREKFLQFFEKRGHQRVNSSSLIPAADPTLLFTNAGMVQFKDCFLGVVDPGYRRATSSQKCVRAGGKHNDLENVGFTPRHHTFFEMLGNFSFGDYFKKEAIAYAWKLLTEVYRLPKERLRITVFETDDDAFNLWKAQGISEDIIYRLGEKDNFWAMGNTGPCGPCSEIHYDWGSQYGCKKPDCTPACECGRFLEIWNLVFMQFNRDAGGNLEALPKPSVDTGAGLERLACVLQRVYSNYDTDLFDPLKSLLSRLTHKAYGDNEEETASMRVVMDHVRAATFLLSDGVIPSNEGRGYVLRRILRRAIRHGKKLEQNTPFLYQLVPAVVQTLGKAYPEIIKNELIVDEMIHEEENKFHETLHRGIGILDESIADLKKKKADVLPGDIAFKLYDTFGFPLDLTQVICQENGVSVDEAGFNARMEKQRKLSTKSNIFEQKNVVQAFNVQGKTEFVGYTQLEETASITWLADFGSGDDKEVEELATNQEGGLVVFDKTPFYAESGGQVGDKGTLTGGGVKAIISDSRKVGEIIQHRVRVTEGTLKKGKSYKLVVDAGKRLATASNHTATHLLHAALRSLPEVGKRVKQAGSRVDPEEFRFDFTCPRALTEAEIQQVEQSVNEEIQKNEDVITTEMSFDQAKKKGALAFFDEKYGNEVRVVRVGEESGPYSVELCGGTHLKKTGDIGLLKITSESSIASGTRRITALTGKQAESLLFDRSQLIDRLIKNLGVSEDLLLEKVRTLAKENKKLQKELEAEKIKSAQGGAKGGGSVQALWDKKIQVNNLQIVMDTVPKGNPKILRSLVDQIRDKLKEKTIVLLAGTQEDKVFLCVGVSKDLTKTYDASQIVKHIASEVGGTGGGRADFAQAGGSNPSALPKVFDKFETWIRSHS